VSWAYSPYPTIRPGLTHRTVGRPHAPPHGDQRDLGRLTVRPFLPGLPHRAMGHLGFPTQSSIPTWGFSPHHATPWPTAPSSTWGYGRHGWLPTWAFAAYRTPGVCRLSTIVEHLVVTELGFLTDRATYGWRSLDLLTHRGGLHHHRLGLLTDRWLRAGLLHRFTHQASYRGANGLTMGFSQGQDRCVTGRGAGELHPDSGFLGLWTGQLDLLGVVPGTYVSRPRYYRQLRHRTDGSGRSYRQLRQCVVVWGRAVRGPTSAQRLPVCQPHRCGRCLPPTRPTTDTLRLSRPRPSYRYPR